MYNKNKRFMHSVLCTGKPKSYPMEEFVKKITTILSQENIRPSNYKISPKSSNVFINFNSLRDMQRIIKRKYNDFADFTIVITPKRQNNEDTSVKIDGVPNYITHEELDDMLSQQYGVFKVWRKFPSRLYPDTSLFIVDMKTKNDVELLVQNLSEIDGCPVVVQSGYSDSGNSSRNSDYSAYSSNSNSQIDQSPNRRCIPKNYKMIDSHSIMRSLTNLLILLP